MKLGFIGTGKITSSVIKGICISKIYYKKIIISPRNKKVAKDLKKKFKRIVIAQNNQEVIDSSNWIFLGITPFVGKKIIKKLKFRSNQTIISFLSSMSIKELKKDIKVKAKIIRAAPLPPISLKKGPIPICPPNNKVKNFFNKIGTVIEIKDEKLSINFWSTSAMMAPFYEVQKIMVSWFIRKKIKKKDAQKYVTSLFLALSEDAVVNSKKDLKFLVKDSQTPKGINQQSLDELKKSGFFKLIEKTLDNIHKRLS